MESNSNFNEENDPDAQFAYGAKGEKDPELIKWQLSGKDIQDEIKHLLRGEVWNITTEAWDAETQPLLNDEGVNAIITIMNQYVNKNTILSTLEEDMILSIMREINLDVNELVVLGHKKFGIEKEYMTTISNAVCNMIYFSLQRALKGGEKTFLQTTEQRRYTFNQPLPEQKQGGGLFGFWGKK